MNTQGNRETPKQAGHPAGLRCVRFAPDGRSLVSASSDRTLRIWDTLSGGCLAVLEPDWSGVESLSFSPDGRLLASGGNKKILLWHMPEGKCFACLNGHTSDIEDLCFSPDGHMLASAARVDDYTVRLWDMRAAQDDSAEHPSGQCIRILRGPRWSASSISFSADGQILAAAYCDCTIHLWGVASGACLRVLKGHTSFVLSVSFAPQGHQLASAAADDTLRIWDAQKGRVLHILGNIANPGMEVHGLSIRQIQGLCQAEVQELIRRGAQDPFFSLSS